MKALIVSSEVSSENSLLSLLSHYGWGGEIVNVSEVSEKLQSDSYRAILVCAEFLPDKGVEFAIRVRALPQGWQILLLSVCQGTNSALVERLLAVGYDDVIAMPSQNDRLGGRLAGAECRVRGIGFMGMQDNSIRSLVESSGSLARDVPYGVFRTTVKGRILEANRALAEMFGYDCEEDLLALELPKDIYVNPEERDQLWTNWSNYIAGQELLGKRRDGTEFIMRVYGRTIRDDQGNPKELEGIVQDVTEQVKAENRLRQTNEELLSIYSGMHDGILVLDLESEIFLRTNPAMSRITGYDLEELRKMGPMDLFQTEPSVDLQGRYELLKKKRTIQRSSVPLRHKNGSTIYCDMGIFPLISHGRECLVGFFRNVTEKVKAEEAVAKTEAKFYAVFEEAALGMAVTDEDGTILQVNKNLTSMTKSLSSKKLIGRKYTEFFTPEDGAEIQSRIEACIRKGKKSLQVVKPIFVSKGKSFWGRVSLSFIHEEGKVIHVVEDITERKEAQEALAESESSLRRVLNNMPDRVVMLDLEGTILYWNHSGDHFSTKEVVGRNFLSFVEEESVAAVREAFEKTIQMQANQSVNARDFLGNWWYCRGVPIAKEGNVENVMVFLTDITKEKHSEEAILEEQELLRRLLELLEKDRGLIAFELHDGFCQQLTGAILQLEAASEAFRQTGGQVPESYGLGMKMIQESITEARRLVRGLRPPALDEYGIVPAIEHLADDYRKPDNMQIELFADMGTHRLAQPLENAIFRMVQESLNNVQQHSQSQQVEIRLRREKTKIDIEVRDWGVGFDLAKVKAQHFGIRGIQERARLLGGRAEIESAPGKGTRIHVELPAIESVATVESASTPKDIVEA